MLAIDEIDDEGGRVGPLGTIAFLAMHPTVLSHSNRLFGADVFGVASRLVEQEMRRECADCSAGGRDPLAAIVNTNEGDAVPIWAEGTRSEAERVGGQLARRILDTYESAPTGPGRLPLDVRYLELSLPGAKVPGTRDRLCDDAQLGLPVGFGGSDHPTEFIFIDDFREGRAAVNPGNCQSPKLELLGVIQTAVGGPGAFPRVAPLTLVRLGNRWISFVPAEVTTIAGRRIRAELHKVTGDSGVFLLGGLANGYIQYVTTDAEYDLQHYESASNLYGRWTDEVLRDRLAYLARTIVVPKTPPVYEGAALGEATAFAYQVGGSRERFPRDDGEDAAQQTLGFCRLRTADPHSVCFYWSDGTPGHVPLARAPWIRLQADDAPARHCALEVPGLNSPGTACMTALSLPPRVVAKCDPAGQIDDRGLDFQTGAHGKYGSYYYWSTIFRPQPSEVANLANQCGVRACLRLIVAASPGHSDLSSPTFVSVRRTASAA